MEKSEPNFSTNEMYPEYPAFSWIYESDSSVSQVRNHVTYMQKPDSSYATIEPSGTNSRKLPLGIEPTGNRRHASPLYGLGQFASPTALVPPTSLAYVDQNSQPNWPVPHLNTMGIPPADFMASNTTSVPSLGTDVESQFSEDSFVSVQNAGSKISSSIPLTTVTDYLDVETCPVTPTVLQDDSMPTAIETGTAHVSNNEYKLSGIPPSLPMNSPASCKTKVSRSVQVGLDKRGRKVSAGRVNPMKRCPICQKRLRRDLTRHMRIHEAVADFACPFPRKNCPHKHGQFNRPYEYKKHLMNCHFTLDDPVAAKNAPSLSAKLQHGGECKCGLRFESIDEWIVNHIRKKQCVLLDTNITKGDL